MEQIVSYDQDLFVFLNGLGSAQWDTLWLFITNKLSSIPLYAVLLYLIYKSLGLRGTIVTVLCVVLLITCVDQLANLFKHGFMRPRPCRVDEFNDVIHYVAVRCGKYGYYSAHAGNSMAIAIFTGLVLKANYKNILLWLIVWSFVVGYSRIYVGVHYPGDVLTGWAIGATIGYLIYRLHKILVKRFGHTGEN